MIVKQPLKAMQAIARKRPKPSSLYRLLNFRLGLMPDARQLLILIVLLH